MLNFTRRLLAFRRSRPGLLRGELRLLDAPEPVLAFERCGEGERLLCVFNLGREAIAWTPPAGAWRLAFTTGAAGALPRALEPLSGYVLTR
jgi:alpha-glucosidase